MEKFYTPRKKFFSVALIVFASIMLTGKVHSQISLSFTQTDVLCYNDSNATATVYPNGGTPPYSYQWNTIPVQTTATAINLSAGIYTVTVTDQLSNTAFGSVFITQPPQPATLYLNAVDVWCYGDSTGEVELNYADFLSTNTYLWSNGDTTQDINNLPAGIYCVTVTTIDSCVRTACITVNQPASPVCVTVVTSQNLVCWNVCEGIVYAIPCGGTPGMGGYTFNWDTLGCVIDTLYPVCAGTYTVTVMDGAGCTAIGSADVTQPPQPATLYLNAVDVLCYGDSTGTVELNYADIQPTDTYMWSNGEITQDIVDIPAGWYQVTVTTIDSCVRIDSAYVSQPNQLMTNFAVENVCCNNCPCGAINLTVIGGTFPYYYQWSNGSFTQDLQNIPPGIYLVTITDINGCIITSQTTVLSDWTVVADGTVNPATGDAPLTVNFTFTGSGADSYLWDFGDGTPTSTDQDPVHIYIQAGTFTVILIAYYNGSCPCTDTTTFTVNVNPASIIEANAYDNLFCIYPNPATDNLQIQTAFQTYKAEITDITGRLLYTTTSTTFDCSGFTKGIYFVKMKTREGMAVKKFIKE